MLFFALFPFPSPSLLPPQTTFCSACVHSHTPLLPGGAMAVSLPLHMALRHRQSPLLKIEYPCPTLTSVHPSQQSNDRSPFFFNSYTLHRLHFLFYSQPAAYIRPSPVRATSGVTECSYDIQNVRL
ncbi:unnamed protein product [Mortierella alpina]